MSLQLSIHDWRISSSVYWNFTFKVLTANTLCSSLLFNVDAPKELRSEWFDVWNNMYPCALKNWLWWVPIFIRERIMAKNICHILENYKEKENPKILIFLQSFHWRHVKFLLSEPSKDKIWEYYFGKFDRISKEHISEKIKKLNKTYYKYWKKYAE